MKNILKGVLLFLLMVGFTSCQSHYIPKLKSDQGVVFNVISLEQAKHKAKLANKPLLVFLHATWCPTCKKMENEVLVQKQLGERYNKSFINVAIDYDSPNGTSLRAVYPIKATPTLFFFNSSGKLIQKLEGFTGAAELLTVANQF